MMLFGSENYTNSRLAKMNLRIREIAISGDTHAS